jgi:hypothetical protein
MIGYACAHAATMADGIEPSAKLQTSDMGHGHR